MTDITELAQSLKAAAEKATQGEWWADEVKNEGCYGSGDDCVEGFTSYAIYGSDGQTLFDSLNSDAACICEEYDGEGHVAWDETAQRNAEFITLANPANVLALVEALEKAQQVDEELCKLLPPGAEYMDPPDGGDITPLEGVRRMVADYRQRIAELENYAEAEAVGADKVAENAVYWMKRCKELESRTVKLPQRHSMLLREDFNEDYHTEMAYKADEVQASLSAAGIKVEAE
ncbi:ead/Ea22-like family protein [Klebsiella pneumoniae]|nr:ead/Ea22-like family protein [Klebsiella pneumoniae]